ncbi:TPA: NosR, partial [Neisseria meningitidis]
PAYIKPNFISTNRLRLKGLPTVLQPSKGTGAGVP